MKNYIVVRYANKPDHTEMARISAFESETEAWKEYYRFCGLAVDSENITDAVVIMTKDGFEIDHKCFVHDAPISD